MLSTIQSWFDLSRITSWRPGQGGGRGLRRRRGSFNRDRRCSFPELGTPGTVTVPDPLSVGYTPKAPGEDGSVNGSGGVTLQPSSSSTAPAGSRKSPNGKHSQSILRKYLLCGCCCCLGKSRQSYNPRAAGHLPFSGSKEDPAVISSRVYQRQAESAVEPSTERNSPSLAQLQVESLQKRSDFGPSMARNSLHPPELVESIDSSESSQFLSLPASPPVPLPASPLPSHTFLSKLSKKSKISASSIGLQPICAFSPVKNSKSPEKVSGMISNQAKIEVSTKRLMKELADLMRRQPTRDHFPLASPPSSSVSSSSSSSSSKSTLTTAKSQFTVELVNELLYEWYIKIFEFDKDSQIYHDMQQYKVPYVKLHALFPDSYPFDPPFIRVVTPYIERGYVMEGGAICLELLTKTGWTSAYTVEAVVIQLIASFVKGQARIKPNKNVGKSFTRKSAENSFRHIVRIHDKHGWVDTPINDG